MVQDSGGGRGGISNRMTLKMDFKCWKTNTPDMRNPLRVKGLWSNRNC